MDGSFGSEFASASRPLQIFLAALFALSLAVFLWTALGGQLRSEGSATLYVPGALLALTAAPFAASRAQRVVLALFAGALLTLYFLAR